MPKENIVTFPIRSLSISLRIVEELLNVKAESDSAFEVFMDHILHFYDGLIANRHKGCLDKH